MPASSWSARPVDPLEARRRRLTVEELTLGQQAAVFLAGGLFSVTAAAAYWLLPRRARR